MLPVLRGPKLPYGPVALEAGYMIEEEPTISGWFLPFPVPLHGTGLLEKFEGRHYRLPSGVGFVCRLRLAIVDGADDWVEGADARPAIAVGADDWLEGAGTRPATSLRTGDVKPNSTRAT